jgi:hypothetical protein
MKRQVLKVQIDEHDTPCLISSTSMEPGDSTGLEFKSMLLMI